MNKALRTLASAVILLLEVFACIFASSLWINGQPAASVGVMMAVSFFVSLKNTLPAELRKRSVKREKDSE